MGLPPVVAESRAEVDVAVCPVWRGRGAASHGRLWAEMILGLNGDGMLVPLC